MDRIVAGSFSERSIAERALSALVQDGVEERQIGIVSPHEIDDPSFSDEAGEYPGQSFVNQPEQPHGPGGEHMRFDQLLKSGHCVVAVRAGSDSEADRVRDVLRQAGARETRTAAPMP